MIKGPIIGLICFLSFIITIIFIFHNFNIKRRFFLMVKVFFFPLAFYVILFAFIPEKQVQRLIAAFLPIPFFGFLFGAFFHFFFLYFYLHLIQIIDRTPTTRIMIEIENSPGKKLTAEQIKERYSIDKKISVELEDLVILGRLKKDSTFYSNTTCGRMHCRIFKFIREYLKLRKS